MRRQAVLSALVAVFLTAAIASAGVLGVVTVLQNEATFLDDAPLATDDGAAPGVVPAPVAPPAGDLALNAEVESIPIRVLRISGGELVPAERAEMRVVQNAQLIQQAPVGEGGVVQLSGIPDGIYSLLVRGPDGFAAARSLLISTGPVLELGLVPWVDMPVVEAVLQRDVYEAATVATLGDIVAPGNAPSLLEGAPFVISADGLVHGRVSRQITIDGENQPIINTRVMFVRNGQVVAEGVTDQFGEFALSGLTPGAHSFVVGSSLGLFAVGTEIVGGVGIADTQSTEIRFVAFDDGDDETETNADPVPPEDMQAGGGTGGPPGGPPPPPGGGGGTGGGTGAGGGGGGGGGILGPLLAGALGAAIGALAADDDDKGSP